VNEFLDSLPAKIVDKTKNMDLIIRSSLCHESIDMLLSQTVLSGGKRLRPLLTYLSAYIFDLNLNLIDAYARASELVHAASLSHDDVVDDATLRRGLPSINIISSNKKAVLAGDYLLSKVIVDLCKENHLGLVTEMSLVIKDLSEGEWLQLDLIASRDYTRELINEIALKKTASVMSYCTIVGAILSNSSSEIIGCMREFGINLGLAFQLIDDTLDFKESTDSLKDQMLDLKNGIVNSVSFEFLAMNNELLNRFQSGEDLSKLIHAKNLNSAILLVKDRANKHLEMASRNLDFVEDYLTKNQSANKEEIKMRINHLRIIISYLALRQN
jgi:geranylgeranyl pyrophosphate synthase